MQSYLIGLDIGTTGSKSMLFSLSGEVISSAYREYPCTYPQPNWVEQDVELVVASAFDAIKECVAKSQVDSSSIRAISISAQRSCGIFLDKDEKLLRPMISWQDSRADKEVSYISERITPQKYYNLTGFPNSATWLLAKMLWVRTNEPEVWEKCDRVVQMHDYFLRALGVEEYIVDLNDAGFYGLFDSNKGKWSSELLSLFDLPLSVLPTALSSSTAVGKVSKRAASLCGLKEGTLIAVGAGDQSAGAVGAGVVKPGAMSVAMGTAGAVTAFVDHPYRDPNGNIMITNHPKEGNYLLEGYQAAAAGVYRWYRDEIASLEANRAKEEGFDYYKLMDEKINQIPLGSHGLLFLPYLAGAATPRYVSEARGTIIGLTFAHDKFTIGRACMEGISMDMLDMIRSIQESKITIESVNILGGPTRSQIWNQIQSDIYGLPVATLKVPDAPLVGAAIFGGVASGDFSSIEEASSQLVKIDTYYHPNKEAHSKYQEIYSIYQKTFDSLYKGGVFGEIAKVQQW